VQAFKRSAGLKKTFDNADYSNICLQGKCERRISSCWSSSFALVQVRLPQVDGSYDWADGKSVDEYDSTVVAVYTDRKDVVGYGEVVPLGPNYLPSYAAGVRAGLAELAPKLIGADPTQIGAVNALMDYHLKGHPYVKSPLDMALWDILGKVSIDVLVISCYYERIFASGERPVREHSFGRPKTGIGRPLQGRPHEITGGHGQQCHEVQEDGVHQVSVEAGGRSIH